MLTVYRLIALSFALCKMVEYIIKIRLDFFLEKNNLIPNNLLSFRHEFGTMEYLSSLVCSVYESFCNKEYVCAGKAPLIPCTSPLLYLGSLLCKLLTWSVILFYYCSPNTEAYIKVAVSAHYFLMLIWHLYVYLWILSISRFYCMLTILYYFSTINLL